MRSVTVRASQKRALARARLRRAAAGFSLIELMVVVIMVAMLAVMAIPALRNSRDDRQAFDYARQVQGLLMRARARAAGRGAAHLVVGLPGTDSRGRFLLFEALDGLPGPTPPGPNPVSSCKRTNQWLPVTTFAVGTYDNTARIVDGIDLNGTGVTATADIRSNFTLDGVATAAWVMCITPNGKTFVGVGGGAGAAITDMEARPEFAGTLETRITRNRGATIVGMRRRILATGTAMPRIRSE